MVSVVANNDAGGTASAWLDIAPHSIGGRSRDNSNFGIGNSICKHGLKLCVSLLDYLGGAL